MKKALISGVTGQDGSYLAELLLSKGYEVHGLVRRSSSLNLSRLEPVLSDRARGRGLVLHYGDLANSQQINNILHHARPQEVYHLGAQSHVQVSFDMPEYTGDVTGLGATRLLEAIRCSGQKARFYQASSSEMFGAVPAPQNEKSPFLPQSPYAAAKAYAFWMTADYRAAYGLHASNGILFNHESPRRGEAFVTRKISRAVAAIKAGRQKTLFLGNLQARRLRGGDGRDPYGGRVLPRGFWLRGPQLEEVRQDRRAIAAALGGRPPARGRVQGAAGARLEAAHPLWGSGARHGGRRFQGRGLDASGRRPSRARAGLRPPRLV